MFLSVTFLILLSQLHSGVSYTCFPNSRINVNGVLCVCDSNGEWSEEKCKNYGRRKFCDPGQVLWQGCRQCICQEDGQLICNNAVCPSAFNDNQALRTSVGLSVVGPWCTPFRSYYVDCSICMCPASGRSAEAHCAVDTSCSHSGSPRAEQYFKNSSIKCLPKVMYLFPCLHCLCSYTGVMSLDKCVETCQSEKGGLLIRRCIPKALYRKQCNVCLCPDDGIPDDNHCTKRECGTTVKLEHLRELRSRTETCNPNSFTKPRCFYCDCTIEGAINVNSCLESDCLNAKEFDKGYARFSCSPGEIVPICTECFCLVGGITNDTFCTKSCAPQNKLHILEKVIRYDLKPGSQLIDKERIKKSAGEFCEPNMLFSDLGRYCLCPENGNSNFKICTSTNKDIEKPQHDIYRAKINLEVNCEPNTFVEFDCNTCFCSKNGTIDPKWCTYDDCEAKMIIQESQKLNRLATTMVPEPGTCTPGSISKVECNFCICPSSGLLQERACTKNQCSGHAYPISQDKFYCDPLAYYEVDCNVCLCPKDGMKNVAKCSNRLCEKSFLRSEVCVPGQLFSDDCNVCVCPPNGDKVDKVCTNHTCPEATAAWKKIFNLSQSLLGNEVTPDGTTRKLDLCFPGEEFLDGCRLCVCPEMGLRAYATCTSALCNEEERNQRNADHKKTRRVRRDLTAAGDYNELNFSVGSHMTNCTPGSLYIVDCKECICPYLGIIHTYCRPLLSDDNSTKEVQEFDNIDKENPENSEENSSSSLMPLRHNHTERPCSSPGTLLDNCFLCICEDNLVYIEEHCFRREGPECVGATPSLLLKEYTNILCFWVLFK